MFVKTCLVFLALATVICSAVDETITANAKGQEAVLAVIEKIDETDIFDKDKQMLRNIAQAESQNGQATNTFRPGFYGGIWQISRSVFLETQSSSLDVYTNRFIKAFNINWKSAQWEDLVKPLYSGLAARLAIALYKREYLPGTATSLDGALPWNVASQVPIWAGAFKKTESLSVLTTQYQSAVTTIRSNVCNARGSEIAFVLDASGSIATSDFQLMKLFMQEVVRQLEVGAQKNQFAVVPFDGVVNYAHLIRLNRYSDKNSLINAIGSIPHTQGGTETSKALSELLTNIFMVGNGVRAGRGKIAVVLTDGASNSPSATATQADLIHAKKDITVLSVGIGRGMSTYYADELRRIASEPKKRNLYQLQEFQDLAQAFALEIKQRSCDEPAIVEVGFMQFDPVTGEQTLPTPIVYSMGPNETQISCMSIPRDTSTSIAIEGRQGSVNVYVSLNIRKPSRSQNDFRLTVKANRKERIILSPASILKHAPNAVGPNVRVCLGLENTEGTKNIFKNNAFANTANAVVDMTVVQGVYKQCGGQISLSRANDPTDVAGPGYFGGVAIGYPSGLRCEWNIEGPANHYLKIEFPYLNLTGLEYDLSFASKTAGLTTKCDDVDHLLISSAGKVDKMGDRILCGSKKSNLLTRQEIWTSGSTSLVTFETKKDAAPGYGFNMVITALPDF